jgi:hypothetical protein
MFSKRFLAAAVAAVAFLATAAGAGTMFRLEVGTSAALGTDLKFKDKNAKKVVVAVRAVVCQDLRSVKITGTAEGLVNGKRQTQPITPTVIDQAEAVYAIQQQWPQDGAWVLHLKGSCANPKAEASTLVPVDKGTFIRETTQVLREPATRKQVEDSVAAHSRSLS